MNKEQIKQMIKSLAKEKGINHKWVESIVFVESNFDPNAEKVDEVEESYGLGQLSWIVRNWYCKEVLKEEEKTDVMNWKDAEFNIIVMLWFIKKCFLQIKANKKPITLDNLIICYNAGASRLNNPPQSTKNYIKKAKKYIAENYGSDAILASMFHDLNVCILEIEKKISKLKNIVGEKYDRAY